jgi:hypothetical protein
MSTKTFESVLSLAMNAPSFASEIFASPEQALDGFDLTVEEFQKFKEMTRVDLEIQAQGNHKSFGVSMEY